MPLKPKIKIQLIKCGTCGKPHNNPFTHVCKIRLGNPNKRPARSKKK